MRTTGLHRHIAFLVFVVSLVGWTTIAQAQDATTLLLVAEADEDSGEVGFWWHSTETPSYTQSETALQEHLRSANISWLDPATMEVRPTFSTHVFGRHDLSAANALNLANLHGADRVITGSFQLSTLPPAPFTHEHGTRVVAELHVFHTGSSLELLPIEIEEVVFAADEAEARTMAIDAVASRAARMIAASRVLQPPQVGTPSNETTILLTGMTRFAPIREIINALKSDEAVTDVHEVWASQGVIAIQVNSDVVDSPEFVGAQVDKLMERTFTEMTLSEIVRTEGRIELSIRENPPIEGRVWTKKLALQSSSSAH